MWAWGRRPRRTRFFSPAHTGGSGRSPSSLPVSGSPTTSWTATPRSLKWKLAPREIRSDAVLHSSVFKRFASDKVQHYYEAKAYRPENLSKHGKLQQYYGQEFHESPAPA